jgi:hypothetical protein
MVGGKNEGEEEQWIRLYFVVIFGGEGRTMRKSFPCRKNFMEDPEKKWERNNGK